MKKSIPLIEQVGTRSAKPEHVRKKKFSKNHFFNKKTHTQKKKLLKLLITEEPNPQPK